MDFQTPDWVCRYMASIIPPGVTSVLEPTPGEGNLVKALEQAGYCVSAPDDFWKVEGIWDAVVMNPPFSPMKVGYEILNRCMELSGNIVALMPWLTLINSQRRTAQLRDWGLKSVTHLPRSVFKGSRVQCCILQMLKGYSGEIRLDFDLKW